MSCSGTPLLDTWYPKHRTNDPTRTLELILSDIWRQYPAWPSTFSRCASEYCGNSSRGGNLCPTCLERALGELVGESRAGRYVAAVEECIRVRGSLYDAISEG